MRGLLIYPPNQLMDIETPRPDGSLGLLYLASALENAGIETDILDASVGTTGDTTDYFHRRIRQENGLVRIGMDFNEIADMACGYDFVGINSNFTCQTRMAFETAKAIKQVNPQVKVYVGGINASALKDRFLKTGYFDGVCVGEGESAFPRMVNPNLPEIVYQTLDDIPIPAWWKLPLSKYEQLASPHGVDVTGGNQRYAPIMTSRGCLFSCAYCHNSTEKHGIRCHSIDRVLREIDILKSLGIDKLFFEDDSLLAFKNRIKVLFKQIKGVSISDVNGVNLINLFEHDKVDTEFIEILKEAGFSQMVFPVESASPRIQKKYCSNKIHGLDLIALMKALTNMDIKAPVNMMIGFPDETEAEIQESIELSKKLMNAGAPYVTFFIPIPFAGSKLCDIAIQGGYLDKDFDTDIMNWKRPVMKNTTVSQQRLEEIRDYANESINTKSYLETRIKQSAGYRLAL